MEQRTRGCSNASMMGRAASELRLQTRIFLEAAVVTNLPHDIVQRGRPLGEEMTSAERARELNVVARAAVGEHEDRDAGEGGIFAQMLQDLEAIEFGQHDVEQDEVGAKFLGALQALFAVIGGGHLESFALQSFAEDSLDVLIVFDQ